ITISCTEKDFIVQSNKEKKIIISCIERVHPLYKKKYELIYNLGMNNRKNTNHDKGLRLYSAQQCFSKFQSNAVPQTSSVYIWIPNQIICVLLRLWHWFFAKLANNSGPKCNKNQNEKIKCYEATLSIFL
ncbi:hypothetical protein PanWU01x14_051960, partial [Parasponia andersonii]